MQIKIFNSSNSIVYSQKLIIKLFILLFTILYSLFTVPCFSQGISINTTGTPADNSAMLDVKSTALGTLIPRMSTAKRDSISIICACIPEESLLIFNTNTKCYEGYINGKWYPVACPSCAIPSSPVESTHIPSATQIIWNWKTVSGATGYKWNTSNDYGTATDMATAITKTDTGLIFSTTYTRYVWAYNACGNSPAAVLKQATFSCDICNRQVWATANANAGIRINHLSWQSNDSRMEKYCYNDLDANCTIYGGLYQWAEALQISYKYNNEAYGTAPWMNCDPCGSNGRQGICPTGYHVPTDLEFSRYEYCLENFISPTGNTPLEYFQSIMGFRGSEISGVAPGVKMKATPDNTIPYDGTNTCGFNLLPAGWIYMDVPEFLAQGLHAILWTSTEWHVGNSWYREAELGRSTLYRTASIKYFGYSVRCLKN
jgi:uncharacterized protein (TIGR02145 family)